MTVGELRRALGGVDADTEIFVRTEDCNSNTFCGSPGCAGLQLDEYGFQYFAIDCFAENEAPRG